MSLQTRCYKPRYTVLATFVAGWSFLFINPSRLSSLRTFQQWTPLDIMPPVKTWVFMGSCLRGTGVAMYDYADKAQTILKLPAPYFLCIEYRGEPDDVDKFRMRFGADRVKSISEWPRPGPFALDRLIWWHFFIWPSHVYVLKHGSNDGVVSRTAVNLIHAVFVEDLHGDRYARVGPEVSGNAPIVPHMVQAWPKHGDTLRKQLNISVNDTVICRYGGISTFDIDYVREATLAAARSRNDLIFLFANTPVFATGRGFHFLPPVQSNEEKATFIRTCDAMLHARKGGETFGLAIAEFALMDRWIITERVSPNALHLVELKERALLYHDYKSVLAILLRFDAKAPMDREWRGYSKYSPDAVMNKFRDVFLK